MKSLLVIFTVLCLVSFAGAADSGFPGDPDGIEVIDKAYYNFSEEAIFYFRLFNDEEQGTVELLKGTLVHGEWEWTLLYTWQPELYNGSPVTFRSVTELSVQLWTGHLLITWTDRQNYEYHEGLASLYLQYDLNSGEAEVVLMD